MTDERSSIVIAEPEQRMTEGPGAVLMAERQALGVTVREVSETLNLSMSAIDALEANDYAKLPGMVFVRGYVRAYARLLELDPDPLIARVPKAETAAVYLPPESDGLDWLREHPAAVLGGAGAVIALVLFVLVLTLWPEGSDEPEATPAPVEEPQLGDPDAAAGRVDPAVAEGLVLAQASLQSARPATEPAVASSASVAGSAGARTVRITESGDDRLTFGFTEDCWVDIKGADGSRLYSSVGMSGSRLELVGEGPFRIRLGYAPGAELAFNGEPVPLVPHTRNNVATLSLGQ